MDIKQQVEEQFQRGVKAYDAQNYDKAFFCFNTAVNHGHTAANYWLGLCYEEGKGTVIDLEKAFQYFLKAAEAGHADAMNKVGYCYEHGRGVQKGIFASNLWYKRAAAAKGTAPSPAKPGEEWYQKALKAKNANNMTEAFQYFLKAAEAGHALAQGWVGWCYCEGKGTPCNDAKGFEWTKKAVENGASGYAFNLGYLYYKGRGVKTDLAQALKWFTKAAENNKKEAFFYLGCIYENGYGVTKDLEKAKSLYQKGIELGNNDCKEALKRLEKGSGTTPSTAKSGEDWYQKALKAKNANNMAEAFQCFLKAAEAGHSDAQTWLGWCYRKGLGTPIDYSKSLFWLKKAANQGDGIACFELGSLYYEGKGIERNYCEAFNWFTKAANKGAKNANSYLGFMYENGYYVPKDLAKAKSWYQKGADADVKYCKKRLRRLNDAEMADDWFLEAELAYCDEDYEKAAKLYRKAAKAGHADAACELAIMYHNGRGVSKDMRIAGQWFRRAAALGDGFAQNEVGEIYYKRKEFIKATKWYEKSALGGFDQAMFNLAWCFHHGGIAPANSVELNYNEAIKLYKECLSKSTNEELIRDCQYQIGKCLELGLNKIEEARQWYQMAARAQYEPARTALQQMEMVERDRNGAESWFKKGEEAFWNITHSQFTLPNGQVANYHGYGAHWDYSRHCEAMHWWTKAAFAGHAKSMYFLALHIYQRGYGTPKSPSEALFWFTKAAERGNRDAQAVLMNKYKYGEGAIKDMQKSNKWLQILNQNR